MKDKLLVFQSDFGILEGTVSQMHGISVKVDPTLRIFDLTHLIPKFNTWEASYSLYQTCQAWPEETVFVSVIDPGVGSGRKSVVVKTAAGHYIVTPDNGTLTHIKKHVGIVSVREIDESGQPGERKREVPCLSWTGCLCLYGRKACFRCDQL
jgi:S-adenosylmethionine hydrolase